MIRPNWPAPSWVRAYTTTKQQNNLAVRDGVDPAPVALNRLKLDQFFNLAHAPVWLDQTHSNVVIQVNRDSQPGTMGLPADGSWTSDPNVPCVVLTGDCLPILLCDEKGTLVSALHGGWRGILGGIIENAVAQLAPKAQGNLMAWLGPAIGPSCFELGPEVRALFISKDPQFAYAFRPTGRDNKWMGDIYELARAHLRQLGVSQIYGGDHCTFTQTEQFYSYRKNKVTGRMASLIWLKNDD